MKELEYLLDTNMVSDLTRHPHGAVAEKIRQVGEGKVCASLVVAAEIRYGCAKMGSEKLTAQANAILNALTILPMEIPVDAIYGRIRSHLEAQGEPIGPNDLFIAAHALACDLILVTSNETEFSRVPGLRLENWLPSLISS